MAAFSSRLAQLERRVQVPGQLARADEIELEERSIVAEMEVEQIMQRLAPTWAEEMRRTCKPAEAAERYIARFFEERRTWPQRHQADLDRLRRLTGDNHTQWQERLARLQARAAEDRPVRRRREQRS